MRAKHLIVLGVGVALLIAAIVYLTVWSDHTKPTARDTGSPDTWSAATRAYVEEQRQLAADYFDHDNTEGARLIVRELLERYPNDYESHNLMARILMREGQWPKAYDAFARSLEINPKQSDSHGASGVIAETHLRKLEVARDHYKAAARLAPTQPQHPLYLANVLLKLNELDDARLAALEALKLDDTIATAHVILANIAAKQGKIDMAISSIQRARDLTPPTDNNYIAYLLRHAEFLRRRDVKGREEALAMLLNLEARYYLLRRVVEQITLTHRSLEQYDQAAQHWAGWYTRNPADFAAAAEAGLAYVKAGQMDEAKRYLRAAQAIKPHHPLVQALAQAVEDR